MNRQHEELAAGRWNTFTLCEQLGNIGSEVERALRWRERGNVEYAMRAADRALELFALTLTCPANKGRLREIARAREVFLDNLYGDTQYRETAESLRRYYLPFAIAARRKQDAQAKTRS